jgi:DNA-binding NarL/FixJ family response regulator
MIRKLVDFALENRFLILAAAILLFAWGMVSFYRLPVEAYPDVANNYVDVIAQWPGISAEQVEQQVTIPLETVMNGIPGIAHVRSWSIFGLSTVEMVFGEDTTNFENRERVLERLSQVSVPAGVVPQMGTDWSPVGQIYFYTLRSTNPQYDPMNLKTLETWVIEKNLKSVPGVPDTNPFGGPTREYQVRLDPEKLVSYGLSIGQVEQQLTNNNANAGGSFIIAGLQQINVREVGLVKNIQDIENTVIMTKAGTALRVKDIAEVTQGPEIRLGQFGEAILGRETVDLVLLDYRLEDGSGSELLRVLGERRKRAKVLVVTAGMSDAVTVDVLAAGADGVFLKHSNPASLVEAIHRVWNGEVWLDSRALRAVMAGARNAGQEERRNGPLTPRERLVLSDILAGFSSKEIAWRLKLSVSTIKNVIQDLFDKAGVRTRSQLVRVVLEQHSRDWLTMDKS